jgi:hypothetical protein
MALVYSGCIVLDRRQYTYGLSEKYYIEEVGRIHLRIRELEKHIKKNIVIGGYPGNQGQDAS